MSNLPTEAPSSDSAVLTASEPDLSPPDSPEKEVPALQAEQFTGEHPNSASEQSDLLRATPPATTVTPASTTSYLPPVSPSNDSPSQPPDIRKRSTKSLHSIPNHDNSYSGITTSNDLRSSNQGVANIHAIACAAISTEPDGIPRPVTDKTPPHDPAVEPRQRLTRPHLFRGATSHMESEYVHMVLALDDISIFYNILAAFFTWVLLAGFVLFPGTFANLQAAAAQRNLPISSPIVLEAVNSITTLPLFLVATSCAGVGILGMLWLTWRWHKNYIWVLNKIFLPGLLNSLAGLLSTLANIYGTQKGEFSQPSRITLIVLISCSGVCLILVAVYALWLIQRIKDKHDIEVGFEKSGKHGEGVTVDVGTLKTEKKRRTKGSGSY